MKNFICLLLITIFAAQTQNAIAQNWHPQQGKFYQPVAAKKVKPAEKELILIILDSSYSMEEQINGERKIDIAKKTIHNVLSKVSSDVWVGLRVYGHKSDFLGFRACKASELKVPIGPGNIEKIKHEVSQMKPVGWTPITYSIQQALEYDFKGLQGKKRIILVSDGMETCNGSPCDYAIELVKSKVKLKIDVIGFGLNEMGAVSQLKCTALATKGKFYQANDADELTDSLSKSLNVTKDVQGMILR